MCQHSEATRRRQLLTASEIWTSTFVQRRDLQQCSELPEKEIQVRPAKDLYNSAERLQEAIEHSSEDRDPGHGFEGNCYILLRITDVMYRCLKEDLIYFEICVDFTFLPSSSSLLRGLKMG